MKAIFTLEWKMKAFCFETENERFFCLRINKVAVSLRVKTEGCFHLRMKHKDYFRIRMENKGLFRLKMENERLFRLRIKNRLFMLKNRRVD